jgi:hypothetical protein
MRWSRPISADDVRAVGGLANERFSPLAGWPPSDLSDSVLTYGDVEARSIEVASALTVVSSRSEFWETQALVIAQCSLTDDRPDMVWWGLSRGGSPRWQDITGPTWELGPSEQTYMSADALAGTATILSVVFGQAVLNGAALVIGNLASNSDIEECMMRCGSNPPCVWRCLAGQ